MTTPSKKSSVCIVSHNGYGAIMGGKFGFIGGIEWQTSLTAKWLARHGHNVSFLTWDEGGPPEEMVEDVRVIKICKQYHGLRGIRYVHPKWTRLNAALRLANADVVYQNGAECVTGQVALWCRRNKKPFVFSVASDMDCAKWPPYMDKVWDRRLYLYGLNHADAVITQTQSQHDLLLADYGKPSQVIPMPCVTIGKSAEPEAAYEGSVLWVGRICEVKRPDRYLELARTLPEITFDLIGPAQDEYGEKWQAEAKRVSNVRAPGSVQRDALVPYYDRSLCLCCTSDREGFPNTFLEAWSRGIPIVSTFDPDGVIVKYNLGFVGKTVEELRAGIERLRTEPELRRTLANNCRRFFEERHSSEKVMPRIEALLEKTEFTPA